LLDQPEELDVYDIEQRHTTEWQRARKRGGNVCPDRSTASRLQTRAADAHLPV